VNASERCQRLVARDLGFFKQRQCNRRAIRDGFCAQHHPDAEHTRREARAAKWNRKFDQRMRAASRLAALPGLIDAARVILREFGEGRTPVPKQIAALRDAVLVAEGKDGTS